MHFHHDTDISEYKKYTEKKIVSLSVIGAALMVCFLVSLSVGAFHISIPDAAQALFLKSGSKKISLIIWNIRLPQALTAMICGMALASSGVVMQSILHNPLASPFTLGVSNAAAFGAAFSIIILHSGQIQSKGEIQILRYDMATICSFFFSMLSAVLILLIAKIRRSSPEVMALTGVAIGSLFTAGTMFLQYFASDTQLSSMIFWTFGDVGRADWHEIGILACVTAGCFLFFVFNIWNYNVMQSGMETAKSLGVNTSLLRILSMCVATLLAAVTVSLTGIIGFIGLVAPHMARRLVGDDHRFLLVSSALLGALLLLCADTCARVLFSPHVLPVSILTAFIGAPVFIYLLVKGYKK